MISHYGAFCIHQKPMDLTGLKLRNEKMIWDEVHPNKLVYLHS